LNQECRLGLEPYESSILVGLIGECAIARFPGDRIHLRIAAPDIGLRRWGDAGADFVVAGLVMQQYPLGRNDDIEMLAWTRARSLKDYQITRRA
jgi:hypothetical protein